MKSLGSWKVFFGTDFVNINYAYNLICIIKFASHTIIVQTYFKFLFIFFSGILNSTDKVNLKVGGDSFVTWKISNKYYETAVEICVIKEKNLRDAKFSEELQAVIVTFDSNKVR